MRLQLTVQRQTLPSVRVLYHVETTASTYTPAGPNLTVSQFLEQVNEVIPLEAGDWGLDDYTVEVRGFECFHFAELGQVLKEDDEVCIRPLQTSDLRERRLSGRYQITSGGRHLIDGVAFGRPLPRQIDRPAIKIPPRKRRRVTYETQDDDDVDELSDDCQAVIPSGLYDKDDTIADNNDEQADDDYVAADDQDSNLAAELQDILSDLQDMAPRDGDLSLDTTQSAQELDPATENPRRVTRSQGLAGLGLQGPALLELLDEMGRPYPGAYNNPLLDLFSQEETSRTQASPRRKRRKTNGLVGANQSTASESNTSRGAMLPRDRRESSASIKNVRFQENPLETPPTTILGPDDSENTEDEDFEPPDDLNNEVDESDKENAEPRIGDVSSDNVSSDSDSSSNSSDTDSDSNESSSSGSSSSGSSESDTGIHQLSDASSNHQSNREETSSSDLSSSSSSSDSEDDEGPTSTKESTVSPAGSNPKDTLSKTSDPLKQDQAAKSKHNQIHSKQKDLPSVISNTAKIALPQPSEPTLPQHFVTPGEGKSQTRKRNERRRLQAQLKRGKESGEFADDATIATVKARNQKMGIELMSATAGNDEFEARRKALLESIASGGVEMSNERETRKIADKDPMQTLVDNTPRQSDVAQPSSVDNSSTAAEALAPASPERAVQQKQASVEHSADDGPPSVQPLKAKPRAKVDLASSRRMLFGALGLRTPKTKEDEKALQTKLMKDVKPVKQVSTQAEVAPQEATAEAALADDDNWRDKIDLRAVECCHEGIRLSTPPFPFVQRWDPQQQRGYNYGKGKKGSRNNKKRKRNNQQYYGEDREEQGVEPARKRNKSVSPPARCTPPITQPLGKPDDFEDDLPVTRTWDKPGDYEKDLPFPEDLALCTNLTKDSALPGTVIAFKKLDMSQETNWQPRVSEYKTAVINEALDDGTLRMTLAHRDRSNQEVLYNPETGERLYHKFEMPGYDSQGEGEEGDNGYLEIVFAELIEPKIVQGSELEQAKAGEHVMDASTLEEAAADAANGDATVDNPAETTNIVHNSQEVEEANPDESWEGIEDTVAEGTEMEDTADTAQGKEMEDVAEGTEMENTADIAQDKEMEDTADPNQNQALNQVKYPDLPTNSETSELAEADVGNPREPSASPADGAKSAHQGSDQQPDKDAHGEVREEIFKLIRDAGWRSSLNPEVRQEEMVQPDDSPVGGKAVEEIQVRSSEPSSPHFNGFNLEPSRDYEDDSAELPAEIAETVQEPVEVPDSMTEPRLPSPRQESRLSNDAADEHPTAMDEDSALWDTQANQQIASEGMSSLASTPKASKPKATSNSIRSRNAKSISPPRRSKSKLSPRISSTAPEPKSKLNGKTPNGKTNGKPQESASSSDEFPSLEKVFARRIASLDHPSSSIPPNNPNSNQANDNSEVKSEASDLDISALPRHSTSQPSTQTTNSQRQHTQKQRHRAPTDESSLQYISDNEGFVLGSQIPQGSQIIDLTMSSDPVEPSDSAYEGDSSLPTGPGWMEKVTRQKVRGKTRM